MISDDPRIKEAYLYECLDNDNVQCNTCRRQCVLKKDQEGFCKTRKNIDGKLYTLSYGDVSSYSVNPVEKKPAYHFFPGQKAYTIGSWGCNFPCDWCQNFDISKRPPPENYEFSSILDPEKVIECMTNNSMIEGISFSFNEPTLSLEFSIDVMQQLDSSYFKQYVTNGYMTKDALTMLIDSGLNSMTVSFKGSKDVMDQHLQINSDYIWENIKYALEKEVHIELVYLVIPTLNDKVEQIEEFVNRIKNELSPIIPVHFTGYSPAYLYSIPKTSTSTLQKVHSLAKKLGLEYVYIGNIPRHPLQSTYCSKCSELIYRRDQFTITYTNITKDYKCPNCHQEIHIYPYRPQKQYLEK